MNLELDRLNEKVSRLKIDIANAEETKKTYEFEFKDAEWSIKELKTESKSSTQGVRQLQQEFQSKRNKERKLLEQSQDLENAIKTLTREYNQLKAEAEAIDAVKKGQSSAISTILDARDRGSIKGIHGTIAELAEVDDDYETAMNVAAGHRMQAVVVDSDEVAAECIHHLKLGIQERSVQRPFSRSRKKSLAPAVIVTTVGRCSGSAQSTCGAW